MKVMIDHTRCQGHALCSAMSNGYLELDDDGYIQTATHELDSAYESDAVTGADACPERVITIEP